MIIKKIIIIAPMLALALLALFIISKLFLYFKYEKQWDSIRFFHYSKSDLKLTMSNELRIWRKRQNSLTRFALIVLFFFIVSLFFNSLISN